MSENINIEGQILDIIYHNPDNAYSVIELTSSEDDFIAVGYMPNPSPGENVKLNGSWVQHRDYGEQFKFDAYEIILPTEREQIYRYLASGVIYGIKAATAKKIVDAFGEESLNVIKNDPERLAKVKGISEKRAFKISEAFSSVQAMQEIVLFLQQYNIPTSKAAPIYKTFGDAPVNRILQNPYVLCDLIDGIGFKTSDSIAMAQGLPHNSIERISSGVKYILKYASFSEGHTYLPYDLLKARCIKLLSVTEGDIQNAFNELIFAHDITIDNNNYYLTSNYIDEVYIANRLKALSGLDERTFLTDEEIDVAISDIERRQNIKLAIEQREACGLAVKYGLLILTGGPGTGKTTTINTIISIFENLGLRIALAAPTGRAAKRMSEVTGYEAKTIHRLLGASGSTEEGRFAYDDSNPLKDDVIILDEVSMIDSSLMFHFLRAVKYGAKLILVGDSDQLPSVGAGNVLADMISSDTLKVISLSHIFRQAEESLIIVNAHRINSGTLPILDDHTKDFFFMKRQSAGDVVSTISDLYCERIPKMGYNALSDIQILTPTRKSNVGVNHLNEIIQQRYNPPSITKSEYQYGNMIFREGDKVMQIKNDYDMYYVRDNGEDGLGIFNGDMGIIERISIIDKLFYIRFDDDKMVEYPIGSLDELTLAYAITVHKSQGNEFGVVIMPALNVGPMLMCRNLFYTAVTRAKKLVILVGNEGAIATMVNNNDQSKRYTGLCSKLQVRSDRCEAN